VRRGLVRLDAAGGVPRILAQAPQAQQGPGRVRRPHEAAAGVLRQDPAKPPLESPGHRDPGREGRRLRFHLQPDGLDQAHARERRLAGGHRPGEAAEGVEVGPRAVITPAAPELLGRHVGRRAAGHLGRVAATLELHGLGQPEVGELQARRTFAIVADEDVVGLQVAVDDAPGMGVSQGIEEVQQHLPQSAPGDAAGQVAPQGAVGQLHGEGGAARRQQSPRDLLGVAAHLAVIEDEDDTGVVQAGHRLDLAAERGPEGSFTGALGGHHLDGDGHPLSSVDAAPDLGHAAPADTPVESEGTERNGRAAARSARHVAVRH